MNPSQQSHAKIIGVLGCGQMGIGIAQVAALSGYTVLIADLNRAAAERGKEKILSQISKLIEKGKLTPSSQEEAQDRIRPLSSVLEFKDCDIVIEAVTEEPTLKFKLFQELDSACKPEALLMSNTSSISITAIAAKTKRTTQVAGLHFMNPVPIMKLVEGIRGLQTSDSTFDAAKGLAESMGKTFVAVRDVPGFAVNRILMPMINEAITALYEGIAEAQDIDTAMKLGTNQPMGPLTLADFIGLDTCLAILRVLHEGLGDPRYRPSPLLVQYVEAGWLGKKSGRGFYRYDS